MFCIIFRLIFFNYLVCYFMHYPLMGNGNVLLLHQQQLLPTCLFWGAPVLASFVKVDLWDYGTAHSGVWRSNLLFIPQHKTEAHVRSSPCSLVHASMTGSKDGKMHLHIQCDWYYVFLFFVQPLVALFISCIKHVSVFQPIILIIIIVGWIAWWHLKLQRRE